MKHPWTWTALAMLLICPVPAAAGPSSDPATTVLKRYRQTLLADRHPGEHDIQAWIDAALPDGRFSDLDYADNSVANWDPWHHTNRVRQLALAITATPEIEKNFPEAEEVLLESIDHFIAERYRSQNWWFNEIGVPRNFRDTAVLLMGTLDGERRQGVLSVVAQHRVRGSGANLMWSAELALHHGCLTGDHALIEEAARRIQSGITVGADQGIQEDGSFLQHGARLQTFHYGAAFADVVVPLGWQLRGTPWKFSSENVSAISHFLLEGVQWMARGSFTVPSTMDRRAARPGALKIGPRPTLKVWPEVDRARQEELRLLLDRLAGDEPPPAGFRHFSSSDFTVWHQPGFSFFVKTVSDRTHLTESINQENLLGHQLNTGDHYLLIDGDEYLNLMPLWNWNRLPGTTLADGFTTVERQPFAGGLGDGTSGLVAMDLHRRKGKKAPAEGDSENSSTDLSARRSWFVHDGQIVSLIGGWEPEAFTGDPWTTLDQSRRRGDVTVITENSPPRKLEGGAHKIENPLAIIHGETAWLPINAPVVEVRLGEASGSWRRINASRPDTPISSDVFLATLRHGTPPRSGGFALKPGAGVSGAQKLLQAPGWQILRNDRKVQAVIFRDGTTMASLFEAGSVEIDGSALTSSAPCLALWKDGHLRLADPAGGDDPVNIDWDRQNRKGVLPRAGVRFDSLKRVE